MLATSGGLTTTKAPFIEEAKANGEVFIRQPYKLYSEENQDAWRRLYARIRPRWQKYAHPRFLEGVEQLVLDPAHIPRLEDVNRFLQPLTGFSARAVSGYVPAYVFFDCLRNRAITGRQLRDIRKDAVAAIKMANDPPRTFLRSGNLVRVAFVPVDPAKPEVTTPRIDVLTVHGVLGLLTDAADWYTMRATEEGARLKGSLPPKQVANDLLAQPDLDLPPLSGFVTHPVFTSNGGLVVKNGYDRTSGLWLHSTLGDLGPIAEKPDAKAVADAREFLLDIVADFPFVDEASRINALSLFLLPFVRPLIKGPIPLYLVDSPRGGDGKTLLVKTALCPALGYAIEGTTGANDGDEWRKKITTMLAGGSPAVLLDNVAKRLDSEHLASVLTATFWVDRLLGRTEEVKLPNRTIWMATGINPDLSDEMTRRTVWIRLDSGMERPGQRTGFRHSDLMGHVQEHRSDVVRAIITLVKAWQAAGSPPGKEIMGSFEDAVGVIGGILEVAGVKGFLGNAETLNNQADDESSEWAAFVEAWWRRWKDSLVPARMLMELLWSGGHRLDHLTSVVTAPTEQGARTQLGKRLSKKRDYITGGFQITRVELKDHSGRGFYRLVPVASPQASTGVVPHTSESAQTQTSALSALPQPSVPAETQTSTVEGGSLQQACTEVCIRKSSTGNELCENAEIAYLLPGGQEESKNTSNTPSVNVTTPISQICNGRDEVCIYANSAVRAEFPTSAQQLADDDVYHHPLTPEVEETIALLRGGVPGKTK
jgi:hypothetical protein